MCTHSEVSCRKGLRELFPSPFIKGHAGLFAMFKPHFSKYSHLNFLSFSSAAGEGVWLREGRSGELRAFFLPNRSPQIAHTQPRAISDCDGEKTLQGWSNGKYLTLT